MGACGYGMSLPKGPTSQPGVERLHFSLSKEQRHSLVWRDSSWLCGDNDAGILLPAVLTAEKEPERSLSTRGETW